MTRPRLLLILILLATVPWTRAEQIYRCGNSYSQQPCAGGTAIDADDKRSSEQRKAHDAAVRRERQEADRLEKERIKTEAAALRAARDAQPKGTGHEATKPPAAGTKPKARQKKKDTLPTYKAPVAAPKK